MTLNLSQKLDEVLKLIVLAAPWEAIKRAKLQLAIANADADPQCTEEFNGKFIRFMNTDLDELGEYEARNLLEYILSGGEFEAGQEWENKNYKD